MTSAKSAGRVIGLALSVQVVLAPPVYFVWMRPITGSRFLADVAGVAPLIRVCLLLTFLLSAMTFTAAIAALPIFRKYSERMALSYLALSIIGFGTLAIENVFLRNMLALSEKYAKVGGGGASQLQLLGGIARETWLGAHFTNLTISHGTVFLLFVILYRFGLVNRLLAGLGMAASAVSTVAVAMPLLGGDFVAQLVGPTGLCIVALIVWLLARGLEERHPPLKPAVQLPRIGIP